MISLAFATIVIIMLTIWGLKTKYPPAFMFCFAVSLLTAFAWYDVFDTSEALTISLIMIIYSLAMAGAAFIALFREVPEE